ncbi:MAG: hypothetical protein LDL26_00715 [Caenispirillum bisanense]|nr:hypothetical protein [Caenispirillum bisanense]MCA1971510.1 hypothetical protein [Caenispirillum sp.]
MKEDSLTDRDLVAFADGRLERDPAHARRVTEWIRNDPAAAEKVEAYITQTRALRDAFPLPEDDVAADWLRQAEARQRRGKRHALPVAAGLAAAILSGAIGWSLGQADDGPNPHLEAFLDGELLGSVEAAASQAPVDIASVPDLSAAGYELLGRKVMTRHGQHVAVLVYRDPSGQEVKLFKQARPQPLPDQVSVAERDGTALAVWEDEDFSYGLVTRAGTAAARALAGVVRGEVGTGPGRAPGAMAFQPLDGGGPAGPSAPMQVNTATPGG